MPTSNERVTEALDQLQSGLAPFVERRLKETYGDDWIRSATGSFRDGRNRVSGDSINWDTHSLLTVMWDQWNSVFRNNLGHYERSLVSELREFRNRWAHQHDFDFDDTYRVVDSVRRLLTSVDAPNVAEVNRQKQDLLESHVAEEVNSQIQRTAFNRNKWWVIGIYALCVAFLMWNMLRSLGDDGKSAASALASILILTLVYLIYQQFKMEPPLLYGPRECPKCHKIVYRRSCPYCEPSQ
ncbi:MAG: hypothetical protein DWQ34_28420 [Planctomycetota bacterium]|nr:MAG: hypothetical protein DWQ29_20030 [Planctomycetota bacterium]REJ85670.1 MAG: hypothetical protein DWQ34_28420 [Planctomycetota bacterium]REK21438.1 MAG: hypothetical protein DWQ41_21650 [Planctomycetota bacterium]REK40050.1 MAG: hypothetical protein DWQ45_00395 [Planctomycetota bacterium]